MEIRGFSEVRWAFDLKGLLTQKLRCQDDNTMSWRLVSLPPLCCTGKFTVASDFTESYMVRPGQLGASLTLKQREWA